MTEFSLILNNIELLVATVSTLIALLFITVDVWRSLSSIIWVNGLHENPLQGFLIASLMLTVLFSFLIVLISGGTQKDILSAVVRAVVFAVIPFIPGYVIFNWASDRLTMIIFTILVPLLAAVVEISYLDLVIDSCNKQCTMVAPLTNSSLVRQLLVFSAKDNSVFQQFLSWLSLDWLLF